MTIYDLEQAILDRIKTRLFIEPPVGLDLGQLEVEPWPEAPEEYQLTHPLGSILVMYRGSKFSTPKSMGVVTQDGEPRFDVRILIKSLRTHAGAYGYLDAIRWALTGWRPEGAAGPMWPVKEDYVGRRGGVWDFGIVFAVRMLNVQAAEGDDPPKIKIITFDHPIEGQLEVACEDAA